MAAPIEKFRKKVVFKGALEVTGAASLASTLNVVGATKFAGGQTLTGVTTATAGVTMNARLSVNTLTAVKVNSGASTAFAGRSTFSSGTATLVISTTLVTNSSLVFLTPVLTAGNAAASQASGSIMAPFCVATVNPLNHFVVSTLDQKAITGTVDIMWEIKVATL